MAQKAQQLLEMSYVRLGLLRRVKAKCILLPSYPLVGKEYRHEIGNQVDHCHHDN